jgi:putative PIN family toxin of toxin-antitoxin system
MDTNVLVSGIFWKGKPGRLIDDWVSGIHAILVTPEIITEYVRVIRELAARRDPDIATRWTQYLSEMTTTVVPLPVSEQCRDHDDQKFLECAYGGKAEMLVTGDADLLAMESVHGIPIVSPNKALLHD